MKPAARIAAVIEILAEMQAARDAGTLTGRQAEQWLRSSLQRRRYAGSGDRAAIGDLFWKSQRAAARIAWHLAALGAPSNPRNIVIAALVLIDKQILTLSELFSSDIAHAPAPLDKTEILLVEALEGRDLSDPGMPEHTVFEWPEWLMLDTKAGLGDRLTSELFAMMSEAPTDIRINPLNQLERRKLRDKLAGRGIKGHPTRLSPLGVRLEKRSRLENLPEWKAGLFDVQDEGSQIASMLCDARPGMQVADICTGAAGKSLVMAGNMQNKGRILALDPNAKRLEQGGVRLRRAGIHNVERKLVAEKWSNRSWRGKFDRVVVDAPCSGSGTWRRRVDAKWQLTAERLDQIKQTQLILLEKARAMVVPGGRIIYIICSVLASEGPQLIKQFLAKAPELECADIADIWADTVVKAGGGACPPTDNGLLQLLPNRDGTDGFFIAVIQARLR
ncbi:RsmB/NOP family class I SAM-dependent RNA methyltransferase [Candidatus Puniceispirillum sp.]|nr:RsmB/NOP family class I SAM-dependent RNA methyltransferase [Candidatus Puniceispirillum sp.]